jgi:malic enzyme
MARDAIVFACGNPVPEIWPWEADEAGASIVATGRADFPNSEETLKTRGENRCLLHSMH